MPGMTLYDKLVASHEVARIDDEHILLYVDLHIMNEYTSPQAFSGLAARGRDVLRPAQRWRWWTTSSPPIRCRPRCA